VKRGNALGKTAYGEYLLEIAELWNVSMWCLGWVERSETHHNNHFLMGFGKASTHPTSFRAAYQAALFSSWNASLNSIKCPI